MAGTRIVEGQWDIQEQCASLWRVPISSGHIEGLGQSESGL